MSFLNRGLIRILIASAALTATVAAQTANDPAWDRVVGIARGSSVKVRGFDGVEHKGTMQAVSAEEIRVAEDGQEVTLRRADVARVEVHSSGRRARNAVIWGAVGLALGVVGAFATCPSCVGETSSDEFNRRLGLGALAGGGIGASLGLLGSPYKTVYKARRKHK